MTRLREAIERDARFQDALDALDMATLWLHRTFDLPHMPSDQADSWERKARSGRVALRAALAATERPLDWATYCSNPPPPTERPLDVERKCGSCGTPGYYAGDRKHPCIPAAARLTEGGEPG